MYVYQVRNRIDLEMSVQLLAGAGGAHITPPIGFPMGGYEVVDARARYRGRYIRDDADRVLTEGASEALAEAFARIDA